MRTVPTPPEPADRDTPHPGDSGDVPAAGTGPDSPGEVTTSAEVDSRSLGPAERIAPTWTEPLAQRLARPFGGRLGRHAQVGRQWFWSPLRVILLLAVLTLAAGWLFKAPCLQTHDTEQGPRLDWSNSRQYTAMCYTDIIPRYGIGDLAPDGVFPYKTSWVDNPGTPHEQVRYMEYPVLTGLFQWVNAKITDGWLTLAAMGVLPAGVAAVVYFDITAFWLACAWLTTIWALSRLCSTRIWDTALAAVAPLAFVHVFTNFDALATMFATTGLLAWSRRRPAAAGVLLGLGAATKLYPLFLLGPLLVLCLRSGHLREWNRTLLAALAAWLAANLPIGRDWRFVGGGRRRLSGGAAARPIHAPVPVGEPPVLSCGSMSLLASTLTAAWLAANLPIMLLYPRGWWEFFRFNSARPADPDSLYNVVAHFTGWAGFDAPLRPDEVPTVLNAVSLGLFLLICGGVGWLALAAPKRPRLAQLCFLVVAAFLITNKVWSPQYSLWLVPLAVLAIPRWRLLLTWMIVDAAIWAPRMYYYLGTDDKGLPEGWFLGAIVVRDAVVVTLCVLVVREILRPGADKVRRTLDADPHGGFLDGARDRIVLPGLARWGHDQPHDRRERPARLSFTGTDPLPGR